MTGIILTGHGNIATGIESAVKLVFGQPEKFYAQDFTENITPELLEQKISQSREWLQQAFSGERDATLAEYSRLTEKKLTRRPPSRWGRLRKKGRKLLARAYHRIRRS